MQELYFYTLDQTFVPLVILGGVKCYIFSAHLPGYKAGEPHKLFEAVGQVDMSVLLRASVRLL